ncbi:MAG: cyclic nucleotide-binding domain-containing protein [Rhizobacter sp.]|nr:cyclic nucleotide-binding domain-containing protein [Chlorobiales bacterium]
MTLIDLFGHIAFLLIALSLLVKDILWLRILSVVASLAGVAFNFFGPPEPLWLVVNWNMVFITVNVIQISLILKERREVIFTDDERELYETMFKSFGAVAFMKLVRLARWHYAKAGDTLTLEHEPVGALMLIYNGLASVEIGGREVARVKDGAFIGEMSLITGKPASATVKVLEQTRYIAWPKADLEKLFQRNPSLKSLLDAVLSTDLTKKLMLTSEAEAEAIKI